ncbi:LCP family protein required for cell wall assembly [Nocardioides daedukensis]|uniref:LCP family protein required for cell wall assembly n=1 Tax=Nocardioides daedukensis TaxID=634462 RepID=A0A7Y9UQ51_9ACTN|nr:LCP family protein [Nocardioides daedukensis]NYG60313.1 LCP family protein required for cell wall assembly [Nocardioides daedukensis]
MTLVVPGSAQLVAGNRNVGRIAIRVWGAVIALLVVLGLISYASTSFVLWFGTNTTLLNLVRFAMMLIAVGWAALFMDAWRIGQPLTLVKNQRLAMVGLNGVLCFSVAGSILFAAHLVTVQREFIGTMFSASEVSDSTHGRYNVLLMGGDSGAGRFGLRPDSLTVASIDQETGRTVLVGLPRNLQNFKFAKGSVMDEQFPDGFDCDECYINGVSTWAQDNTELFADPKTAGTDATISAVEGVTGLKINYWAMVNLEGFRNLIDAVGGVTLNVRHRIPIGGFSTPVTRYIEPGVKKLNGYHALWFARSRTGSDDYARMARQKCVMNALATQISPKTVLANFEKITKASSAMVDTNLPASELDTFIGLALKAKSRRIGTVSIVPPAINTAHPDLDKIRTMVDKAIDKAEGKSPEPKKARASARASSGATDASGQPATSGGSLGNKQDGYTANESADLGAAC